MRWVAVGAVVLLYVLHQDFWFWHDARPLVFGFLPIGLFYHVVFTVATAGVLWLLVKVAWPAHLEAARGDGAPPASDAERGAGAPAIKQ
jgi:hypothetical protein